MRRCRSMNDRAVAARRTGPARGSPSHEGSRTWPWLGLALAALLGLSGPAGAVTIDGRIDPGEWGGAKVIITDPDEPDVADNYDAHRIMMDDGNRQLYTALTVYGDYPELAAAGSYRPYLNFYFNLYAGGGPAQRFGLTYNDGYGFGAGEMHLVHYYPFGWRDLGEPAFAIDEALEVGIPWTMLPPELTSSGPIAVQGLFFMYNIAPGDANNDGAVSYMDLGILATHYGAVGPEACWTTADFNLDGRVDYIDLGILASHYGYSAAGGAQYDMFDEYSTLDRNLPLTEHTPEPATILSVFAGLAGLAGYIRRRHVHKGRRRAAWPAQG